MLWDRIKRLLRACEIVAAKRAQPAEDTAQPRSNLQPRSHMLALEPRLMFDAAALVTAADGAQDAADASQASDSQTETQQDDQSEILDLFESYVPPAERSGNTLVFIDASVPEQDVLVEGLAEDTEVIVLEAGRDGVEQISEALDGREGLTSIHIVSHGDDGVLRLGNTLLSSRNMDQYTTQLTGWGDSLTEQADILIYGCDVANGETGQDFIEQLAQMTGADINASTDATGSAELGGDWELEASAGAIESDTFISPAAVSEYDHLLETVVPHEGFEDGLGTGISVSGNGSVTIVDSGYGSTPTEGNQQVLIESDGSGGGIFGGFASSATLEIDGIEINPGDILSFDFNYLTNEGSLLFDVDVYAEDGGIVDSVDLDSIVASLGSSATPYLSESGYQTYSFSSSRAWYLHAANPYL